jgi:hypothetical protein
MMRKLLGKCALALTLPPALAVLCAGGAAPAAMAAAPAIHFDGSPGTSAPPGTLGPFPMTKAAADSRPVSLGTAVSDFTLPDGTMTFSPGVLHLTIGHPWATWSNGYTGDVYYDSGTTLTMTLPAGTSAFYFYVEPNTLASVTVAATAQDGTTSGPESFSGFRSARYFGFYGTGGATVTTITVSGPSGGFAVGEFGVASAAGQLVSLGQAVQGVGPGNSLSAKIAAAHADLTSGDLTGACNTLTAFVNEVNAQSGKSIPAGQAAQLIAEAQGIQAELGC